jgi:Tol biopolymer transport system component
MVAMARRGRLAAGVASAVLLCLFGAVSAQAERGRIAFADQVGANDYVFTVHADGTHRTRVTSGASNDDTEPSWSPNGGRIVFVRQRSAPSNLFTIKPSGHDLHRIRHTRSGSDPAWSPDGAEIAFVAARSDGKRAVVTIRPDGSHRHRLTPFQASAQSPSWSPGGNSIVFANSNGIVKMAADGRHKHLIEHGGESPSWSPNGNSIAFTHAAVKDGVGVTDVFTMRADGSHRRDITHGRAAVLCDPAEECPRQDSEPDWSPHGERIAFDESSPGNGDEGIYTIRPNGTGTRHITPTGHSANW